MLVVKRTSDSDKLGKEKDVLNLAVTLRKPLPVDPFTATVSASGVPRVFRYELAPLQTRGELLTRYGLKIASPPDEHEVFRRRRQADRLGYATCRR